MILNTECSAGIWLHQWTVQITAAVYMPPARTLLLFTFSAHRACITLTWLSQQSCANSIRIFEIMWWSLLESQSTLSVRHGPKIWAYMSLGGFYASKFKELSRYGSLGFLMQGLYAHIHLRSSAFFTGSGLMCFPNVSVDCYSQTVRKELRSPRAGLEDCGWVKICLHEFLPLVVNEKEIGLTPRPHYPG